MFNYNDVLFRKSIFIDILLQSTSAPVVGLIRHIIAHGKPVLLSLNEDTGNSSIS